MKEINTYVKKYLLITLGILVLRFLIKEYLPELFIEMVKADGYTQSKPTLFSKYNLYLYNLILSIFIFIDLNKLKINKVYIPILTIFSMSAGLFFFGFSVLNKLIDTDYGKK